MHLQGILGVNFFGVDNKQTPLLNVNFEVYALKMYNWAESEPKTIPPERVKILK